MSETSPKDNAQPAERGACVVLIGSASVNRWDRPCDEPAAADRGGYPMCPQHLEMFDPSAVWEIT